MEIILANISEREAKCDALILPVYEDEGVRPYQEIDNLLEGVPSEAIKNREFAGKLKQAYLIQTFGRLAARRVLLLGLGKKSEITPERLRLAGGRAVSLLTESGAREAALSTSAIKDLSPVDFLEGGLLARYKFRLYKREENGKDLEKIILLTALALDEELKKISVLADAVYFTRNLVNTPSNDLTPCMLAKAAKSLEGDKVTVKVLGREEAQELGMGLYLAVAKGSAEAPQFIVVDYKGAEGAPIVFIGKAVTFDSGGINIKPSEGMEKMKYDMAGGAAVLGVIKAASELNVPIHVMAVVPATENLPSGTATKPGDVVRAIDGKAVEILNTDAEGRLALADAIGYARKFLSPRLMVDIATLTGACSIALGNEAMAMMSNDDGLAAKMEEASQKTGERVWRMPLFAEYKDYIESDIADLKNIGGRAGGLVTAAYFLKEFAGDTPWVHLDIAGTAWTDKDRPYIQKGATGIGVRLLFEFLKLNG
jgi:leucyl aminopeptidase